MNATAAVGSSRHHTYRLSIERDREGRVAAIELQAGSDGPQRTLRLNSYKAALVAGAVHEVLRASGVPGRAWASGRPIQLDYLTGTHLELLVVAARPLRRADRVERVVEGVAAMSTEEASYWHAKLARPGGLPALRLLLGARRRS